MSKKRHNQKNKRSGHRTTSLLCIFLEQEEISWVHAALDVFAFRARTYTGLETIAAKVPFALETIREIKEKISHLQEPGKTIVVMDTFDANEIFLIGTALWLYGLVVPEEYAIYRQKILKLSRKFGKPPQKIKGVRPAL